MKTLNLFTQLIIILATMLFFACEGEQGEPGPVGPQGEQGIAGKDGQEGADGQAGNVSSFYFQDGFKGYDGTQDVTIYNQADVFVEIDVFEIPSPNSKNLQVFKGDFSDNTDPDSIHTLMKFDNLKQVIDAEYETDICSQDFFINEAVIYVSGVMEFVDGQFFQVGFYSNESPVFDQSFATWDMANETEPWGSIGGKELWQYGLSWFDQNGSPGLGYLYQMNDAILTNKAIYVPREVAQRWICEDNPGLLLSYYNNDFIMIIYSSENENQDSRPMLYLNIERNDNSANRQLISEEEAFVNWKNKSYQEKMAPFYEAHPHLK